MYWNLLSINFEAIQACGSEIDHDGLDSCFVPNLETDNGPGEDTPWSELSSLFGCRWLPLLWLLTPMNHDLVLRPHSLAFGNLVLSRMDSVEIHLRELLPDWSTYPGWRENTLQRKNRHSRVNHILQFWASMKCSATAIGWRCWRPVRNFKNFHSWSRRSVGTMRRRKTEFLQLTHNHLRGFRLVAELR